MPALQKLVAMPVVFQGRPASLYGVLLAVIRRIVNQVNPQPGGLGRLRHGRDELRAITSGDGAAIKVRGQGSNIRIVGSLLLPPLDETIDHEGAGFRRLLDFQGMRVGLDQPLVQRVKVRR